MLARAAAVTAVKKALEAVALKERQTTLVLPDAAMRVLLLDFDTLPAKAVEALPVVRFRLKKLLPFDSDEAVVSYQVMSHVAATWCGCWRWRCRRMCCCEYESVVREAGFEPGAVLPSTLAVCAGLEEDGNEAATLLVNAGENGVTTAIVREGVLLLHRTVDLQAAGLDERIEAVVAAEHGVVTAPAMEIPAELLAVPVYAETYPVHNSTGDAARVSLPLVNEEESAGEWAMQAPVTGYGVLDERDLRRAEDDDVSAEAAFRAQQLAEEISKELEDAGELPREQMLPPLPTPREAEEQKMTAAAREVTQAVSVAAAYFEDTLERAPGLVLSAGTLGADGLGALLREAGFGQEEMRVMETVDPRVLTAGATTTRVPRGWMAGVRGALRS